MQLEQPNASPAELLASLNESDRLRQLDLIAPTAAEKARLEWFWPFWARPKQRAPDGAWLVWLILAGRGFGKTRTGAQWAIDQAERRVTRGAIVGRTAADVRDVMVEGDSGIMACSPPWFRPRYEPSKRRLTWPNGSQATTYSADKPDQLRGPQAHWAWADELAAWRYTDGWDQLRFGNRLPGVVPRIVVTTTPRPIPLVRELIANSNEAPSAGAKRPYVALTRGSTFENQGNLAPEFLRAVADKYVGTRLGRQELYAEVIDDAPGALWKREVLDSLRVREAPSMTCVVVGVDPAMTSGEKSNETGIVVVGLGVDGHAYVLLDASDRYSPSEWAAKVAALYEGLGANKVVAEVNQGGDLVESNLRATGLTAMMVRKVHASHGKRTRAEPVAALYEQGRVHHVGSFPTLEDQQCTWEPDLVVEDGPRKKIQRSDSPDRLDALVWAITDLMVTTRGPRHALDEYDE